MLMSKNCKYSSNEYLNFNYMQIIYVIKTPKRDWYLNIKI